MILGSKIDDGKCKLNEVCELHFTRAGSTLRCRKTQARCETREEEKRSNVEGNTERFVPAALFCQVRVVESLFAGDPRRIQHKRGS